ncbi:MAG TPA: TolC family protein [Anaeromyxobacteraceae bacterium]|nr:TolC family protein [Anaeromyxobacteraceae bacterium]
MTALLALALRLALAADPAAVAPPQRLQAAPALTLEEALRRARSHPRVAQSAAAEAQAGARSREARAGFLPSGQANASYTRATSNSAATPGASGGVGLARGSANQTFPFYAGSLNLTVPIWDFGRTLDAFRSAREAEAAAREDLAAARHDVDADVRAAFFGALAAEELVQVADDTIAQMQKHLDFAQASLEVGRRTRFDVTRAQVDLTNARIQKIQADNGVATARASLAAAVGEAVGDARLVAPAEPEGPDPVPAEASRQALERRPELAALARRIAAADASVGAARSAWYPVLAGNGQLGWRGEDLPLVRNWQVGVTLTWPFLDGGADLARVQESRAALEGTQAAREAEVLQIRAEVEQAALAVIEAHARRDAAAVLVGQARENLELAEGRYQAGVGTIIELADAQAALSGARAQGVRAGYDLAIARARLRRAVGDA